MKSEKRILIAFLLNFTFSVFEFFGGLFTGSVAILSDSVHDIGDAASIGISWFLEKKSKQNPDSRYTYGYARYSVLGSMITTLILVLGSVAVIWQAVSKMIHPAVIRYNEMIWFAVFGVLVNFGAALFTRGGHSLNQKAVNLHMLEDVLGWLVVLVGAVVMKFTDFALIDPIMSVGVAVFILLHAVQTLKEGLDLFLEKTPAGIEVATLKEHLTGLDGVADVHHIHIWSLDGQNHYATMHIVTNHDFSKVKQTVREELAEHGIVHATLELETPQEQCSAIHCHVESKHDDSHHHHHHHRH